MNKDWEHQLTMEKCVELERLLGRQMIRWMADDETFVTSYWSLSSDEAVRRCQLETPPHDDLGNDAYYLFKIYRVVEQLWCQDVLHRQAAIHNPNQTRFVATPDDFVGCRTIVEAALEQIKDGVLIPKIHTILNSQ